MASRNVEVHRTAHENWRQRSVVAEFIVRGTNDGRHRSDVSGDRGRSGGSRWRRSQRDVARIMTS